MTVCLLAPFLRRTIRVLAIQFFGNSDFTKSRGYVWGCFSAQPGAVVSVNGGYDAGYVCDVDPEDIYFNHNCVMSIKHFLFFCSVQVRSK